MFENQYKHYIRIDENNYVIKAFSNAFEQPLDTDILIAETEERHFNLNLFAINSAPKYKWVDGQMVETTEEEQQEWLTAHISPTTKIAELKSKLANTDYAIIKIAEGAATIEDYADLIAQRQAWREEINQLGG